MFTIDSIPDDLVENDDKEQFIKKKIEKKYSELNKLAKTATELEIKLGQMLNTLKEVVRKDGKKWKRYVAKNFPYMSIRTVQRWMKLAKAVDIESHPSLAYVGQTRLLTLANLAKRNKVEVDAFLKDGGVSLNFKKKKKADVGKFRNKVDALIKKKRTKKKVEHTTDAIINRFLKTASSSKRKKKKAA